MAQTDNTSKERRFQHLTLDERGAIAALRREGLGVSAIARKICRDRSAVSRELRRGTVKQRESNPYVSRNLAVPELIEYYEYFADIGQRVYNKHRRNCVKPLKLAKCAGFIACADSAMLGGWSPDATIGRYRLNNPNTLLKMRNIDLAIKVRLKPKTARVRARKKILGASIDERPADVEKRDEFGHWETDAAAVNTLVERKTRLTIATKLPRRTADATKAVVREKILALSRFARSPPTTAAKMRN